MKQIQRIILLITLLAVFCTIFSTKAYAQVTISGTVSNSQSGETIPGVIISLTSAEGKILKYTTSDATGQFAVRLETLSAGDSLHASMLGYAPLSLLPSANKKMQLQMSPEAINIREVTIRAPKIQTHGDTVKYNVSSFAEAQDKNLGDVLKKMPGIDVDKAGQIKYNGTPINKLYIEGLDMLGGKYSLATNNIPPKDVKSVEVLENHQPTKALQDIAYSEQAALNIKLQEGAKAKWIGTADLNAGIGGSLFGEGAGDKALWKANLFGMRIGAKWQSMNTFKTNNTGIELKSEISSHNYSDIFSENSSYSLRDFFSVGVSNAPLSDERVRLNRSYLFSTNNSFKVAPDYQLNLQASYFHETLNSENSSQTQYFVGDSTITVREAKTAAVSQHSAAASAELLANTEKFYLKDKLAFTGEWANANTSLSGSFPNTQKGDLRTFDLSNDFKYTRRIRQQSLSLNSYNQLSSKPQSLDVLREDTDSTSLRQHQEIFQRAFYSNTSASYGLNFRKGWSLSLKGGFKALLRTLESSLLGISDTSSVNNIHLTLTDLYLQPTLVYKSSRFTASLNIPLNYHHYDYLSSGSALSHDSFLFKPRLYLKYNLTPKFLLSASATIGRNSINEQNLYDGMILNNYRYLSRGIIDFSSGISKSVNGGFEFKDPINNLFFNGTLLRSWNTSPYLNSQTFAGNYIINTLIPYSTNSDTWYAAIGGTKGFYGISGLLGLDASVTSSEATMLQTTSTSSTSTSTSASAATSSAVAAASSTDPALTPYRSTIITVSPRFSARFAPWLFMEYCLSYTHSILDLRQAQTSLPETSGTSHNNSFDHSLSFTITPVKPLSVKLSAEHYFCEITPTQNKNTILADFSARYTLSEHIELSLTAANLLNQPTYTYTTFSGPSTFTSAYQIRPLTLLLGIYWKF